MTHRGSHYDLGVKTALWLQTTPLLKIEIRMAKEFHVLILMSRKPMIYFKSIRHRFGKK